MNASWVMPLVVVSLAIFGCSTPNEVRKLAATTAANTMLVNSSLDAFAANSLQTSQRRALFIEDVNGAALELRQAYLERLGAMRHVENAKDQKAGATLSAMIGSILAYVGELDKSDNQAEAEQAKLHGALVETQKSISLPSEHLKALSKTLGTLSKERDNKATLEFLSKYFYAIAEQYKEAKTSAESSNQDANSAAAESAVAAKQRVAGDLRD